MSDLQQCQIQIKGMDCPDCAQKIEKGVKQLPGISSAQVNFVSGVLTYEGNISSEAVNRQIINLGYEPLASAALPMSVSFSLKGFFEHLLQQNETRLGLVGLALFLVSLLLEALNVYPPLYIGLQITGLIVAGYPLIKDGLSNLWINHDFNINLLMAIAAVGAIIIGDIEEGVTLILLFVLAEALEGYTTERARGVLGELSGLAPDRAIRLSETGEAEVDVKNLVPGERLLVKPGERIPMDGFVLKGTSEVNQAPITGESIPVLKEKGDKLFAGTINGSGALEMQVTGSVADNTLARIISLITEAQSSRSARERMIDRFSRVYTPAMVVIAILVAAVPPLFFGQSFFDLADGTHGWFYRALALLVISCPCALVLSTPVAAISAIARAARSGVLIKGGAFLETLPTIKAFAFDKTGTLTRGEPVVAFSRAVDCTGGDCEHCQDVLAVASSLERRSTHPLAKAVINAAEANGVINQYPPAEEVVVSAGRGISGMVNGGEAVLASHKHFDDHFEHSPEFCALVSQAEAEGHTTILLYNESRVRGFIAVSDMPRFESAGVVKELKSMGKTTIMLTGDNASTAQAIGQQTGVDLIKSSLLPEQKVEAIRNLSKTYGQVAMIGDGINDTPAMSAATLGIAIGGASSAQAMETADVILMAGNLKQLPYTMRLAAYARKIILQNLALSLGVKAVFIFLALLGFAPLWLAVLADSGMAVVVVINSLRPLRFN
ncbi:MAG: cation-translocating P-type ATPase [Anaerolineae bacterium]|nr:cation-translocating P-type ATPase [Anaerolineae bacterium]